MRTLADTMAVVVVACAVFVGALLGGCRDSSSAPETAITVDHPPRMRPEYSGVVMPPNIAPLNFAVRESGRRYFVRIRGTNGEPIEVAGRGSSIIIPEGRWAELLAANRGQQVYFDVFVQGQGGKWT